ncbi:radical SAM/SPASM domain-containing protein [Ruegeria sp. PrR005]|uniref:SPASM domain-containing protein n=1 Tax=Ruegeria sp. PrR005 TaxID=2706882 RepID=A0A6B2NQA8_9RHOB|nr:radical SAM protein [Ruegeria sp. PrR005]NDW45568.1 SPASM domain-containing protein [Ruegeria sp. PrR005]
MKPDTARLDLQEPVQTVRDIVAPYFDRDFYVHLYRDVAEIGTDPLDHYVTEGWREGRDPSPFFSTTYYLAQNPDVQASGVNPYWHFIVAGQAEGRTGCPTKNSPLSRKAAEFIVDGVWPDRRSDEFSANSVTSAMTVHGCPERADNVLEAPIPSYFTLDVSSHCNLKCPYCATGCGQVPMDERGYITDQDFEIIFDKIKPYARIVDLFNWGEPFMHKGILGIVEKFSLAGIRTQISSNLSVRLFSQPELERIVLSGLHSLLASIDGVTQQAYEAYRKNGSVSLALRNLENIRKTRSRLNSKTPKLTWAYYLNRHNETEIEAAKRMAAEMGVDIWFKELSCPEDFQTTLLKRKPDIVASPPNADQLWLPRANPGLGSLVLDKRLPSVCNVCRMPFEVMTINFNGDVYPCTTVTGEKFRVGNLLEESVPAIWAKMRINRKQLLHTDVAEEQSHCWQCVHFPKPRNNRVLTEALEMSAVESIASMTSQAD